MINTYGQTSSSFTSSHISGSEGSSSPLCSSSLSSWCLGPYARIAFLVAPTATYRLKKKQVRGCSSAEAYLGA